jgi:hypothetical protein
MKVHELRDLEGRVFAFEVENAFLGRTGVCRVVSSISGARVVRRPKFLSWFREDEFCEFEIAGRRFAAEEPYGDNSRYSIGPKPPTWCEEVKIIIDAFSRQRLPLGIGNG